MSDNTQKKNPPAAASNLSRAINDLSITNISKPLKNLLQHQQGLQEAIRRTTTLPPMPDPLKGFRESQKQLVERLQAATTFPQIRQANETLQKTIEIDKASTVLTSPETLGKILREERKRLKLSQEKFADLTGVGRRFISELERGKPSLEFGLVLQVCKAAGIDILAKRR